jgi:hypothetical protein
MIYKKIWYLLGLLSLATAAVTAGWTVRLRCSRLPRLAIVSGEFVGKGTDPFDWAQAEVSVDVT